MGDLTDFGNIIERGFFCIDPAADLEVGDAGELSVLVTFVVDLKHILPIADRWGKGKGGDKRKTQNAKLRRNAPQLPRDWLSGMKWVVGPPIFVNYSRYTVVDTVINNYQADR